MCLAVAVAVAVAVAAAFIIKLCSDVSSFLLQKSQLSLQKLCSLQLGI